MGRAKPSAPEHTSTPVLSPISDDRDDVMDLHWPPVSSWAQGKHTVLRSWPDKMPAPCQHLFLRHWWDIGTHAVGAKEWRRAWKCWELNRVKEGWRWINGAKKYRGGSKIVNDRDVKKLKPHGTIIPLQQGFDKRCSHCLLKKCYNMRIKRASVLITITSPANYFLSPFLFFLTQRAKMISPIRFKKPGRVHNSTNLLVQTSF